jgi:Tfp pilus assembly protein PilN
MSLITLTPVRAPVRVNLLPPQIEERRRLRRVQTWLAGAAVLVLAIIGLLYWQASASASNAAEELRTAQAEQARLNRQAAQYAEVPAVLAQVDAARKQLATVKSDEVHWSTYLTDLSLRVPSNIWLTQMQVSQAYSGGTGAPTGATSNDPLAPTDTIGTITYTGYALTQRDVATWLDALSRLSDGIYPYVTQSAAATIGDTDVVQFTSSVLVKNSALVNLGVDASTGTAGVGTSAVAPSGTGASGITEADGGAA